MSDCIQNPASFPLLTFLKTPDLSMGFAESSDLALCGFSDGKLAPSAFFLIVTADETEDAFNELSDRLIDTEISHMSLLAVYHFSECSVLLVLDTNRQLLSDLADSLSDYGLYRSFCDCLSEQSFEYLIKSQRINLAGYLPLLDSLKLS